MKENEVYDPETEVVETLGAWERFQTENAELFEALHKTETTFREALTPGWGPNTGWGDITNEEAVSAMFSTAVMEVAEDPDALIPTINELYKAMEEVDDGKAKN